MRMTNAEGAQCLSIMMNIQEKGKLGYAIAKNMRKLNEEMTEYFAKRDELIMKHGENQEGNQYRIAPDKVRDFLDELKEYDEIEFDFDPQTISEDDFCSGGLTSDQMFALYWMVKE